MKNLSPDDSMAALLVKTGHWVSGACRESSHTVVEVLITVHMVRLHMFMEEHNVLSRGYE